MHLPGGSKKMDQHSLTAKFGDDTAWSETTVGSKDRMTE